LRATFPAHIGPEHSQPPLFLPAQCHDSLRRGLRPQLNDALNRKLALASSGALGDKNTIRRTQAAELRRQRLGMNVKHLNSDGFRYARRNRAEVFTRPSPPQTHRALSERIARWFSRSTCNLEILP
jgi:hypothetical protein